ncbi:MAG: hypothetical protein ACKOC5_13530 [Chloroflexota bacterium]
MNNKRFWHVLAALILVALAACSPAAPAAETSAPLETGVSVTMAPATTEAVSATSAPATTEAVSVTSSPSAGGTAMPTAGTGAQVTQALPGTGSSAASLPEVAIDAADFTFKMEQTVPAGWVQVTLTNSGVEPHHVQLMRLNTNVTYEQFQAALAQGEGPALALVEAVGGVGPIVPGGLGQVAINLPEGEYVVICFIPSPGDNIPHFAKGMVQRITVSAAQGTAAAEPQADLSITMRDYGFDIPTSLSSGPLAVKVTNEGPEWHELNIYRLAEGKTMADVVAFQSGTAEPGTPPPFIPVGGINGLSPNLYGYMLLNLEPGNYVAICNIPSAQNQGKPHFMLGMVREFTVAP